MDAYLFRRVRENERVKVYVCIDKDHADSFARNERGGDRSPRGTSVRIVERSFSVAGVWCSFYCVVARRRS